MYIVLCVLLHLMQVSHEPNGNQSSQGPGESSSGNTELRDPNKYDYTNPPRLASDTVLSSA